MDTRRKSGRKMNLIRQLLGSCRSTDSRTQFRVCFRNISENEASLYWINFKGKPVFYGRIRKGKSSGVGLDIDTFVSHPWIAVDWKEKQPLAINFTLVFRPITTEDFLQESIKVERLRALQQHHEVAEEEQSEEISPSPGGQHVDAFITEMVLKLETSCCLKVCKLFTQQEVEELDIPKHIKENIADIYDYWILKWVSLLCQAVHYATVNLMLWSFMDDAKDSFYRISSTKGMNMTCKEAFVNSSLCRLHKWVFIKM